MRYIVLLMLTFWLAACAAPESAPSSEERPTAHPLEFNQAPTTPPDLGPAPELVGDVWLNAAAPLRLADLYGQVVLIDMWTFG
jgi:hypothetical protein